MSSLAAVARELGATGAATRDAHAMSLRRDGIDHDGLPTR
jgi:hypothetical protein